MKHCGTCKQDLELSQFHRSKVSRDGLQHHCKACSSAAKRRRYAEKADARRALVEQFAGKECPACHELKPWTAFHKLSTVPDGHQVYCKLCERVKAREYRARHAEVIRQRQIEKLESSATTGVKTCTKCGVTQPILSFYQHRGTKDGRATYCKDCQKVASRAWTAAHSEHVKARNAARQVTHPGEAQRNARQWNLRLYGLTEETYAELLAKQNDVCAICLGPETQIDKRTGLTRRLSVDHDHDTLKVRGLLCCRCNWAIGRLGDTHEQLARAAAYLRKASRL
jgi:hypothetical protein